MGILVFTEYILSKSTDNQSPIQYCLYTDMSCCARALATLYKYTD